jgi:hypothetical protein
MRQGYVFKAGPEITGDITAGLLLPLPPLPLLQTRPSSGCIKRNLCVLPIIQRSTHERRMALKGNDVSDWHNVFWHIHTGLHTSVGKPKLPAGQTDILCATLGPFSDELSRISDGRANSKTQHPNRVFLNVYVVMRYFEFDAA